MVSVKNLTKNYGDFSLDVTMEILDDKLIQKFSTGMKAKQRVLVALSHDGT